MSFTAYEPATLRLHRSELAVPAANPKMIDKASRCAADVVFLDLEDSVAPDDKPRARQNVIAALNDIDWGSKTVSVRVNGLDTHYTYRDVIEVVAACPRLDLLSLPKVGVAADVYALDVLVTQIEQEHKRRKRIGFEAMAQAARDGRGAVSLDGRMIDIANIRMAQRLLVKADAIAAAGR
jgi:malyl-CoA/(S)-citramalyl-CoA lyase